MPGSMRGYRAAPDATLSRHGQVVLQVARGEGLANAAKLTTLWQSTRLGQPVDPKKAWRWLRELGYLLRRPRRSKAPRPCRPRRRGLAHIEEAGRYRRHGGVNGGATPPVEVAEVEPIPCVAGTSPAVR